MGSSIVLFLVLHLFLMPMNEAQVPGFLSLDCGGSTTHTDDIGLQWTPDNDYLFGQRTNTSFRNDNKLQYGTVRYFPQDDAKYCYDLKVATHERYLVRATFLYGNFDNTSVYPKFYLSLGATYWDMIVIEDPTTPVITEMVVLASSPFVSVCLFNATSGVRFISTIELRQFNGSMYYTMFETQYFMLIAARANMGAQTNASIRYPDDPFDRIWESDTLPLPRYLYNVGVGTQKIATKKSIFVNKKEAPPVKVMQTAVVGNGGILSCTLNLNNFPGNAWISIYMAEIEDLSTNETRIFGARFLPRIPANNARINVQQKADGKYRVYETGFWNISLSNLVTVEFTKTNDSTYGPILNAFEIYKYVLINFGSPDATAMDGLVSNYQGAQWAQEGGDPCLPVPWTWVQCNSDSPPRIISLRLSGQNLTGNIPQQLTNMSGLVEVHLDWNSFSGEVPDFSGLTNIEIIHLENNKLTGPLPSSLASLPNLKELYVQNNNLSGVIPKSLLTKNIVFNYSGNPNLHPSKEAKNNLLIIIVLGAVLLLVFIAVFCWCSWKRKDYKQGAFGRSPSGQSNSLAQLHTEPAYRFQFSEIEVATEKFGKLIGKGGFGSVYYGKLREGSEIAVKVHNTQSNQGIVEFINEVTLLSRIHHRNLVTFLGYSQRDGKNILVYEFMHGGSLAEHLRGPQEKKIVSWLKRMEIAEDAAKGIEYLHKGCSPAILHRDLKSSNILLDKNMNAKVSDFGLSSKLLADESHITTNVKGTVGYLDPEYYETQHFTEKSDIYSFGVILLELISGYNPIFRGKFGDARNYIVSWALELIASGNIHAMIDKSLKTSYDIKSVWKITEIALQCVKPRRMERPSISEVLKEIQEAIVIEQKKLTGRVESVDMFARKPIRNDPPRLNKMYSAGSENTESLMNPSLR